MNNKNIQSNFSGKNVPVNVAAKAMGKSPMFVRIGLQRGILQFGVAIKTSDDHQQYDYYISPKLFADYTGYLHNEEGQPL